MRRSSERGVRVAVLAATAHPWHGYGGLERHVWLLCRALRAGGVAVDLFTAKPERPVEPFRGDSGFRHHIVAGTPFSSRRSLVVVSRSTLYPIFACRMGARVLEASRERSFDAVIAQGLTGFGYAWQARRPRCAPPMLWNPHGMEEAVTPNRLKRIAYGPFRGMSRYAAHRAARVIATDEALVPVVQRVFAIERGRVAVIPNGIDTTACLALVDPAVGRTILSGLDAEGAAPLLVTTGRLAPNKGHQVALDALARVEARWPRSWRWVVVGDGPCRGALVARARALHLESHVRFAAGLSDAELHSVLATADLFLNPTLYEGSSLVTLEAMAHARPIVAGRAGGIPDKILDGETGWLVEPGDVDDLADGISRWWGEAAETRERIGAAARRRCVDRFDVAAVSAAYGSLIDDVAADRVPRALYSGPGGR